MMYRYKCDRVECNKEYISKSARTFGKRFKEHLKVPSPINECCNIIGQHASMGNLSIVGRESQHLTRTIKETVFVRVNNPSLKRNIGKYQL